ncbi:hemoglobin [Pseudochelatococcus lubricantis]|uniref:Hemoglobin n=1 Tax=Pseudochelatococcus lubricantis TaxID=1538102 RepID=A0ABX0UZ03_9HYPH|nr:group III truncated hemoglobin [Pseudochelatococcus lubricantis]NIJ58133.1 hemoglobin [Pseudochelatococcus lubricantis]
MEDVAERRAQIVAEIMAATGIDDAMIARLVDAFYARVREDAVLGPVFNTHVADWDIHLAQMRLFWSSVALMSGRYHGRPMPKHMNLPVDARHFDHWLRLFESVAREVCPPAAAEHFLERARRIAENLEYGVAVSNGAELVRGERFINPHLPSPDADGHTAQQLPC